MRITIEDVDLNNKIEVQNIVRMLSRYLGDESEPKTEEPKATPKKRGRKPKAEEPKAEEPKAEEPKAEESKAEEPKAEEPKAEEPKAEEPKVDRADVVALAKEIAGNGKRDEVKALINEYAPKLSAVPDNKLGELYIKLQGMRD